MNIQYLNKVDYQTAYKLQLELVKQRNENKIPDTLLLLEHPPVIVIGRSGKKENILVPYDFLRNEGIEIVESNRGGNVTFHSQGQLIGYPIIDLKKNGKDIHIYLRKLEQVIICLLYDCGIRAQRINGYTGVWVGEEKIASIGIAAKNWVTFHGFALNVNNNLNGFSLINSCGIKGLKVTSISKILNKNIDMKDIYPGLTRHFIEVMYNVS